ncbi:hypothetical protein J40TS1_25630 [Paenibacillus montaniterrae]|uniref:DUF4183 domain-containing protein n=1 Tax=Paenibacillus montaniterrae TaxID=429341 RepID=A0A919YRB1_9BACL|nr:hypothetical protein J40TS1_25630 [Paenibacillus montaniterrae]
MGRKRACTIRRVRTIEIRPKVKRYFYITPTNIELTEDGYVISPKQCMNDRGNAAESFCNFGKAGYFNLYINGVMQGGSLYKVNSRRLALTATGQTIYEGTPIILESIGFYLVKKK